MKRGKRGKGIKKVEVQNEKGENQRGKHGENQVEENHAEKDKNVENEKEIEEGEIVDVKKQNKEKIVQEENKEKIVQEENKEKIVQEENKEKIVQEENKEKIIQEENKKEHEREKVEIGEQLEEGEIVDVEKENVKKIVEEENKGEIVQENVGEIVQEKESKETVYKEKEPVFPLKTRRKKKVKKGPPLKEREYMEFQPGDRIFAKMRGFSFWPAKVGEKLPGKTGYTIYFYGTYEKGVVKNDAMIPYNEETKVKYAKLKNKAFKTALEEIEKNIELPKLVETKEDDNSGEDIDGELLIDESTKKEAKKVVPPATEELDKPELQVTPKVTKSKQGPGSSKKDAIKQPKEVNKPKPKEVPVAPVSVLTPPTLEAEAPQGRTSRSGRKIKPKTFADDYLQIPTTKPAQTAKTTPAAKMPPKPRNLSPDINYQMMSKKTNVKKASVTKDGSKDIKAPEDIPSTSKTNGNVESEAKKSSATATKRKRSAPQPPKLVSAPGVSDEIPQDTSITSSPPPKLQKMESKVDEAMEIEENEANKDDHKNDNNENHIPKLTMESYDDNELADNNVVKTVVVKDKDGEELKITYEDKPDMFNNDKEKEEWDKANKINVSEIKLEFNKTEEALLIKELANEVEKKVKGNKDADIETVRSIEEEANISSSTQKKICQLRTEGETIEIVADIIGLLNINGADCERAIELLDRMLLNTHTSLMLNKHPEIINTIYKLQYYVGGAEVWGLTAIETETLNQQTKVIREKSEKLFKSFKQLYNAENTDSKEFAKIHETEVSRFKAITKNFSKKARLSLTLDDNGEIVNLEEQEEVPEAENVDAEKEEKMDVKNENQPESNVEKEDVKKEDKVTIETNGNDEVEDDSSIESKENKSSIVKEEEEPIVESSTKESSNEANGNDSPKNIIKQTVDVEKQAADSSTDDIDEKSDDKETGKVNECDANLPLKEPGEIGE